MKRREIAAHAGEVVGTRSVCRASPDVGRNEMRLKQLLGILLLLFLSCVLAAAATPELTNITVSGQSNATTITLHASGAFTHNEYRPTDNLLIVDLAGVAPGKLKDTMQTVAKPGVASYHVTEYKAASGSNVARVEVSLDPGAVVAVSEERGSVNLRVIVPQGTAAAQKAAPVTAVKQDRPSPKPLAAPAAAPKMAQATGRPATVNKVAVVRTGNGMDVEILASAKITGKVMKLAAPDRVVVDVPNAVPMGVARNIAVNSGDVRQVRVGRFQAEPPVTRVVIDLAADRGYELIPSGNKLTLRLRGTSAVAKSGADTVAAAAMPAATQPKPAPVAVPASDSAKPATATTATPAAVTPASPAPGQVAQDYVEVQAHYTTKTPTPEDERARADAAANAIASNTAAESARLQQSILPTPSAAIGPAVNLAAEQQAQPQQAAVTMRQSQGAQSSAPTSSAPRYTGEPISVNLKDVDIKDFFRLIHEISGLNIVLDPSVNGTVTLVLDDVPWDQALDIVLQNNGLDRRLEGNVLRIATVDTFRKEAEGRRAQAEALALAVDRVQLTHFLSYAHAADVMPIVKRFLSARGDVVADPRTNALIIEDIPSVLPGVQRLLAQLDRKTQEVSIEARVVAATRSFARDIGMQLGFGWGNGPSAVGGATAAGVSPIIVNGLTPNYITTNGTQIPLFSNLPASGGAGNPLSSGLSFVNATSNYRVDAILTMAEARGLLKILSRPHITTQNNIGATVRQGVRIPVVTAAQLGGPPTTTFIPAELRLQVTPQVTAENTIFLNVDVENTTPDFSRQVAGNPTLITQEATTSVLVTDGGTVVIGGVIQTQNSLTVQQIPLLGDIPVLGNLFKRKAVDTSTQELIFFITPKIVQT